MCLSLVNILSLIFLGSTRAFYHSYTTRRLFPTPSRIVKTHQYANNDTFDSLIGFILPNKSPKVQLPVNFSPPEPKPLTVTRASDYPSLFKSALALALRLGTGVFVLGWKVDTVQLVLSPNDKATSTNADSSKKYLLALGPLRFRDTSSVLDQAPRPKKPLILYEYDASPYCRRVRETLQLLDIPVELRPCPSARYSSFSDDLFKKTGRRTVPYLMDPNTQVEMFESSDQIEYLLNTYGPPKDVYDRKALWPITWEAFSIWTSTYAAILRDLPGSTRQVNARADNERMKPLELWGYDASPFVRPVREKLEGLCLPHVLIPCARGSRNRDLLVEKMGTQFQVPFLVDPNTGIEMFESVEICDYLEAVYTTIK